MYYAFAHNSMYLDMGSETLDLFSIHLDLGLRTSMRIYLRELTYVIDVYANWISTSMRIELWELTVHPFALGVRSQQRPTVKARHIYIYIYIHVLLYMYIYIYIYIYSTIIIIISSSHTNIVIILTYYMNVSHEPKQFRAPPDSLYHSTIYMRSSLGPLVQRPPRRRAGPYYYYSYFYC